MKKFKNKMVGVIEVVTNEEVIKQYLKYNDIYELIEDKKAEPTLKELKEQADGLGITYNSKVTKAELLELINNND